jgi:uncharacterized membrane protein
MATTVTEKSSTGLDANIAAALAYLGIPAVIFLAIEKDSQFVRFHSVQALLLALAWIVVWIALMIFGAIPFIGLLVIPIWFLAALGFFIIWVIALIKAFQGEKYKFPVIGDLAEQQARK